MSAIYFYIKQFNTWFLNSSCGVYLSLKADIVADLSIS